MTATHADTARQPIGTKVCEAVRVPMQGSMQAKLRNGPGRRSVSGSRLRGTTSPGILTPLIGANSWNFDPPIGANSWKMQEAKNEQKTKIFFVREKKKLGAGGA